VEDLFVDGRLILKLIFKNEDGWYTDLTQGSGKWLDVLKTVLR